MNWKKLFDRYIATIVFVFWAIGCFCFFQFWYPYHFFFQEQNLLFLWSEDYISTYFENPGGLAGLAGDFLTQFYYYLYLGATILTLCLLLTGCLCYKALRNLHTPKVVALVPSIAIISFLAVCHFNTSYRLSATLSVSGWAMLLWLLTCIPRRKLSAICFVIAVCPWYLLFGSPQIKKIQTPDFILEKDFAVDCEYYFGNHDKVLQIVETSEGKTDQMLFFYNLVQAHRGMLPDHLLKFTQTVLGTFYKIGPDTPMLTIRNMNELYWLLGDMTFTERAAMMTNVFSLNNRNVRMIRRLAECNYVSGDSLAAEKYLRILDKTLLYKEWAKKVRTHGKDIYHTKIQMVNPHDTITISDNAHFLMMQLLDHNPENTIALDYILCSNLLLKDMENFKRDYDRYCMDPNHPSITMRCKGKTLYQEALCIWLAGTNAPQKEWERYLLNADVLKQFKDYNAQRGHPRFKGTYWYYFDKIKAPKV